MAANLVADGALNGTEGVHVLGFGAGAELLCALGHEGDVGVASDVTAFHAGVGDAEGAYDVADCGNVGACQFGCALAGTDDGSGDDLDQGHACAVVVDQGGGCTLDSAVCAADVGELACVFFHVGALDFDGEDGAVFEFNVQGAVFRDGAASLGGLEVLRGVRVEVVLAGEVGLVCNLAAQCQAELDGGLNSGLVHHGQRAGQAERYGGDVGVGFVAELVGCGVEHLGLGVQFDVHLEAEDRVVLFDGFFEAEDFFTHYLVPPKSKSRIRVSVSGRLL